MATFRSKQSYAIIGLITFLVLSVPFIAMQFTTEVQWSALDFMVAEILLFSTGIGVQFFYKNIQNKRRRMLYIVLLFLLLVFIWVELAVGIIDSPFAGS